MPQKSQIRSMLSVSKVHRGAKSFHGRKKGIKEFWKTSALQAEQLSDPLFPTEDTAPPKRSTRSVPQTGKNVHIKAPLVPPPPGAHSCETMLLCCLLQSTWALLCGCVFVGVEKQGLVFKGNKGIWNLCHGGKQRAYVCVDIHTHTQWKKLFGLKLERLTDD